MTSSIEEMPKIAVVGLGNELLSDEGFGIKIVREFIESPPFNIDSIHYLEGGVKSHSLLPLFFDYDYLIFLDVVDINDEPGSIYLFEMDDVGFKNKLITSFHDFGIEDIYKLAKALGSKSKCYVVGIVPEDIESIGEPTDTLLRNKEKFISITKDLILKCLDNARSRHSTLNY